MITVIHSKGYAFAWYIIGKSMYLPSDRVDDYATGQASPNYPMPVIDYYNSADPAHIPIGNVMEWSIPVDVQLKFRVA